MNIQCSNPTKMFTIFSMLFISILYFGLVLAQVDPQRFLNQWKVEDFTLQRFAGSNATVTVSFQLYRSSWFACPDGALEKGSRASGICFWQIVDNPLFCEAKHSSVGTWHSCAKYARNVDGEGDVSAEAQKSLRWRISTLDETAAKLNDVQVQIVNAVPMSKYGIENHPVAIPPS
jgi:hypothetical protein